PADRDSETDGCRHRRCSGRQHLPMWNVQADSKRGASRRIDAGGWSMKSTMTFWRLATVVIACALLDVSITAQTRTEASKPFEDIAAVLASPRCANCHISGDAPLQGEDGHPHAMRVRRGLDGRGTPAMRCSNCHQEASS